MAIADGFHVDSNGNLWLGSDRKTFDATTRSEAPFYVWANGDLVANSGTFSGNLSAAGGTFTGSLTAVSGTFTGELSGGTINIGGNDNSSFHVDSNGNMWVGSSSYSSAPFKVSSTGALTATSATSSGYISAGGAANDINNNSTEINGGKIEADSLDVNSVITDDLSFDNLSITSQNIINTLVDEAIGDAKIASGLNPSKISGFGAISGNQVVVNASSGLSILYGELNLNNRGITNANDLELNNGSSFTSGGNLIATGYVTGDEFRGNNNTVDIHRGGTSNGIRIVGASNGAYVFTYNSAGSSYTLYNPFSDERLKENITDINYGLEEILQLRPITYDWKDDVRPYPENTELQYGLLAQEVEAVMPDIVDTAPSTHIVTDEDGNETEEDLGVMVDGVLIQNTKSYDERPLTYALIKAVQELSAKNDELESRLAALEG